MMANHERGAKRCLTISSVARFKAEPEFWLLCSCKFSHKLGHHPPDECMSFSLFVCVCVCVCVCVFIVVYSFQLLNESLCSWAAEEGPSCWVIRWKKSDMYKCQIDAGTHKMFSQYFYSVRVQCCHATVCTIWMSSPRLFLSVWDLPESENHKALTQFSRQQIPHLCRSLFCMEQNLD